MTAESRSWAGFVIGVFVEALALGSAFVSAGGGHGTYGAAKLLFPVPMWLFDSDGLTKLLGFVLGLVQFPLYGILFAAMTNKPGRWPKAIGVLFVLHGLPALLSFGSGM